VSGESHVTFVVARERDGRHCEGEPHEIDRGHAAWEDARRAAAIRKSGYRVTGPSFFPRRYDFDAGSAREHAEEVP
jgi:hypothetical protein